MSPMEINVIVKFHRELPDAARGSASGFDGARKESRVKPHAHARPDGEVRMRLVRVERRRSRRRG